MSSFTRPLDLRFHNAPLNEKPFELLSDFEYKTGPQTGFKKLSSETITVPAGYRTDFASVPKFFHRVINPIGRYGKAAVVHDWLCDVEPKICDHKRAAEIFGEAMQVLKVPAWKRKTMVWAVLIGGPRFKAGAD